MKTRFAILILSAATPWLALAGEEPAEDHAAKHAEGSSKVADLQDELSADVQQLTVEQTVPQVIELLNKVEEIMDETTDKLAESETGGDTIAAQTEIIEKIHEAAKAKQQQQQQQGGGGQSSDAMMDMMERMMGKKAEGDEHGKGKGGGESGDQGGEGATGLSDAANDSVTGGGEQKAEARRIPKASGNAGHAMPEEFRKALDAYNRGAEQKVK
ncbi:MAG: hypothetical protein EOP88_24640 [Verrucomicrobiaceae bacterium]|nr:MAG: hypothetical protein EOP88_24640 [Verrucomicrobiaceae bacterium]